MQRYSYYQKKLGRSRILRLVREKFSKIPTGTLVKNLALAALACFLFGAIVFLGAYAWYSRDLPDPDTLVDRDIALSTKIYDRTGEHLLYEIATDEKRTLVTLDDIPDYLEHAVIAAEDANFYEHHGISITGILRAVIFRGQRGGGSTITQQLVKNAILTNEKTGTRKFKEIILSLAIERNFSKEQILQMYFNEIGYGGRNYGIESASQEYYGKHVSDLTLSEAVALAGMPQRPSAFLNNPDLLQARRDRILDSMVALEYLDQATADATKAEPLGLTLSPSDITAPHFIMWVKEQLVEKYTEHEVEEGGLKVITSLDIDKQTYAEEAVTTGVAEKGATYGFNNSGLVAIDPKTGQVLAMVGSAQYDNEEIQGQVNVTMRPLQPGSSFKPLVFAAGFEKGYTPNTILWDVNTIFPTANGPYEPKNYDVTALRGPLTARKALQGSLNIPAVKMLYLVGVDRALDFAERLGYTTLSDRSNFGLAIVLGGAEVKLLEHTNAYATFANNGIKQDITAILRVEDSSGAVLEEWKPEAHPGEQIIESKVATALSNVLSDNNARSYVFGPASALQLGARPVAAKTGTTNDYNDAWTMGYTPSLAAGVWVGNTDGAEMNRGADGSIIAAPIWKAFMEKALEGSAIEAFPAYTADVTGKAVLDGEMPTQTIVIDSASGKLATPRTPERFRKELTCGEYHTILQYVNKDEPRGAMLADPTSDPSYTNWEAGIQAWIATENAKITDGSTPTYTTCEIPTEEDDVHTERNTPSIDLRDPNNNDDVDRSFTAKYRLELRRDFSRVEFAIDGSYVSTSADMSSATINLPSWVDAGEHILTATVYDDVDNAASADITIDVTEGSGVARSPQITNPFSNQVIERSTSTYAVSIEIPDADAAATLRLYSKNMWTGSTTTVGVVNTPGSISSVAWTLPNQAQYSMWAQVTYNDGAMLDSEAVRVYVKDPAVVVTPVQILEPVPETPVL